MPASSFQVKLGREWTNYTQDEDKILKRAYLAGFPHARYTLRKQKYEANFKDMIQKNLSSGKLREIRPPFKWSQPAKPIVEAGPTFCMKVPPGSPGTAIQVPHPRAKGSFITVNVPASAKVGQAMLVPIPKVELSVPVPEPSAPPAAEPAAVPAAETPSAPPATKPSATPAAEKKSGMSTGAKVATGAGVAVVVGGLAVAGAVLGEHIAEEGWDATMAELGDVASTAGEHIVGAAETAGGAIAEGAGDAGEWIAGAAGDTGDFVMDLF
ncbi:unnamed protein product [Polarella glacialis]|uniref:WWE domain-containing protein n=1 Tax=Polarella glacialis TaxID=89957 RepID=A0A813HC52_POLGL|nr:unnamed protein product [Polarella glacialis]CAE8635789.1 unnamed protein product [Polarella glacialis]